MVASPAAILSQLSPNATTVDQNGCDDTGTNGLEPAAVSVSVQRVAGDSRNAAISSPLRTSNTSLTRAGWFQVFPSMALKRATSVNWSGVAATNASSPSSESTTIRS